MMRTAVEEREPTPLRVRLLVAPRQRKRRPQSVVVEIELQRGSGEPQHRERFPAGRTGADGVRVIPRLHRYFNDQKMFVAARVIGLEPVAVELAPKRVATETPVVRLPKTGSLRVRVLDGDGKRLREQMRVGVGPAAGSPEVQRRCGSDARRIAACASGRRDARRVRRRTRWP